MIFLYSDWVVILRWNPFLSMLNTLRLLLFGRIHFPRTRLGQKLMLEDGREWTIFREVRVDPPPGKNIRPGAIFRPRFHVAGMTIKQNILFSWLPVPFFIGLPGFCSKLWLVQAETGDFQGIYEWETVEDAERYAHSFAMRFMTRRSLPGSVSCRVIPTTINEIQPSGIVR